MSEDEEFFNLIVAQEAKVAATTVTSYSKNLFYGLPLKVYIFTPIS